MPGYVERFVVTPQSTSWLVARVCASRRSDATWFVAASTARLSTTPNQLVVAMPKSIPMITMTIITSGRVNPLSLARYSRPPGGVTWNIEHRRLKHP